MIESFMVYINDEAEPVDTECNDKRLALAFAEKHQLPICYRLVLDNDDSLKVAKKAKIEKIASPINKPADSNELSTHQQGYFEFKQNKLLLHCCLDNKLNPLSFDFNDGEVGFRAARVSKSNEVVAKAIGCKSHYRPTVLDATAGMGRDSLIMALLGCQVFMQERNFAIYQLLDNALQRFKQSDQSVSAKLNLLNQDSIKNFSHSDKKAIDVIYLDPMFPSRKKSALVKKEMRIFKLLAGEDLDADSLLIHALQSSAKRVVVKRPKGAPLLAGQKPSHEITAKKFRYDVYLIS
jgi:16S rRNA (guanine1516-N2)-methyltransferase